MELEQKRTALLNQSHCLSGMCRADVDNTDKNSPLQFTLISDNNAGLRRDWGTGDLYIEVLDVNGAKFDRLRTLLKDHNPTIDNSVARWHDVKVEDGKLIGSATFGTGEDEQNIRRKFVERIIDSVSVRYSIEDYTVETREDEPDIVTVTSFNILEASAVVIPFDKDANMRDRNTDEDEETLKRVEALESYFNI